MSQPMTISLPLHSHVLIDAESLFERAWSLPSLDSRLFSGLPTCLHDRHAVIRNRMIEAWRESIAWRLRDRLQRHLNFGGAVLNQRMHAWKLALALTSHADHCTNLLALMSEIASELFDAGRIKPLLKTVITSLARNTRHYSTAYWVDHEYRRVIARISTNANSILRNLLRVFDLQNKVVQAINQDAAEFGFQIALPALDAPGPTSVPPSRSRNLAVASFN